MADRLKNIKRRVTKDRKIHYKNILFPEIPLDVNDIYAMSRVGDRLDLIAYRFYGSTELWWIIAIANKDIIRRDSYSLKPGLEIRIPINIESIIEDFEKINKDSTGYGYK